MNISEQTTDTAILQTFGQRLARYRLDQQMTQAEMAQQAGIGKRTVERIEAGYSAQLASVIRILRVLGRLSLLDQLLPDSGPGPMDLLQLRGKIRKRASANKEAPPPKHPWTWDDRP